MADKPDQVRWLEGVLGRPLHPAVADSVLGRENRKCYQVDQGGNIVGLNLSYCRVTDGSFLTGLPGLTSLVLSSNRITDGSFVAGLPGLISLDLSRNQINNLIWLPRLTRLRTLNLEGNKLTELPREVLDLGIEIESQEHWSPPQSINVARNPLKSPPPEIIEQGHAAIVSWFKGLDAKKRPLNEVKVILVGDGGAGKTSVRKRLMGQPFDPNEPKTHGVLIDDWDANDVRVHFWDFGGQEIMHATHQFFLSRRSLYLLVLDGRKECERRPKTTTTTRPTSTPTSST